MLPPMRRTAKLVLIALAASALGANDTTARAQSTSTYEERPLKLPQINLETKCPVSVGKNDIVSSAHQYIFGAGGYFFGTGPVYFALSWKPVDRDLKCRQRAGRAADHLERADVRDAQGQKGGKDTGPASPGARELAQPESLQQRLVGAR